MVYEREYIRDMALKQKVGTNEVWSVDDASRTSFVKKGRRRESQHSDDKLTALVFSHPEERGEMNAKEFTQRNRESIQNVEEKKMGRSLRGHAARHQSQIETRREAVLVGEIRAQKVSGEAENMASIMEKIVHKLQQLMDWVK